MRSPRGVAEQAGELVRVARAGARAHGGGALRVARTARRVRRRQGFEYGEALRAGLLDRAMSERDRAGHASRHGTLEAQRRLNPEALGPLTGDKGIFYRHCADVGLPVPRLFAIVGRAGGWRPGDRPLRTAADLAGALADDLPEWLVVKPCEGSQGRDVRVLRRDDADPARLHRELVSHPEFDAFLVQERLRDHEVLRALGSGETLQTLRLVTLVERSGEVTVLTADMRVAVTDDPADNFRSGRSGNGVAPVRMDDGVLGLLRLPREDRCGLRRVARAPGSGALVEGLRVPHWEDALALVRRAAPFFLPARTLGWDIALTPAGPVIVETNMFWWPRTDPGQAAVLARLQRA